MFSLVLGLLATAVICVSVAHVLDAIVEDRVGGKVTKALRELRDHEQRLSEIENVEGGFRNRLREVAPVPLRRVIEFSLNLYEKFFTDIVRLTPIELEFIRQHVVFGFKYLATAQITIKEWQGFTEISVRDCHKDYPARNLTIYPMDQPSWLVERHELWWRKLPPSDEADPTMGIVKPTISIALHRSKLVLSVYWGRFGQASAPDERATDENTFLQVPIYGVGLESFKRPDKDARELDPEDPRPGEWCASYEQRDDAKGIGWDLLVKDFQRYADKGDR